MGSFGAPGKRIEEQVTVIEDVGEIEMYDIREKLITGNLPKATLDALRASEAARADGIRRCLNP